MKARRHPVFRLLHTPVRRWLMLPEAALSLLTARIAIRLVPFSRIGRHLGTMHPPGYYPGSPALLEIKVAEDVRWAINAVASRSPLEMVCLPRALAAWSMLHSRGIHSRLHFGAPLQPERGKASLQTHAWLSSCGIEVTGYPVAHGCVEVGFFSRNETHATRPEQLSVATP